MSQLVIVWRVTEHCNLACPFCAYDRTLQRPRSHAQVAEIRRFGTLLTEWRHHTGNPVLISWLGGEPLLWQQLTDITLAFSASGFAISTTTNGTSLHQESARRHLLDHYAELTVSVDAFAGLHDALRARPGLFHTVREGVIALAKEKQLAGRGPLLRVNTVLMRSTIASFPALCRELADWRIEEITCNQLGGIDRPEFYPANRLLPDQIAELTMQWPALRTELAARGVTLRGGAAYLHRFAATARAEPMPIADCHPGRQFLFISESGIVSPCNFTTTTYGVPMREIVSLADLLALPARFGQQQVARRAPACDDCQSTQVCEKFVTAA